ncbi:MAG: cell envelope biogenesis protein TolA [Sphingobium sp.]|nr:cell envelope biogenesis protein TolA [Sphingobium sp.]
MNRAEKIGFGVASAAHVLLFAALSGSWFGPHKPLKLDNKPIEISIADEVALRSSAPKLADSPPPPTPGDIEGAPEEAAPAPSETLTPPEPTPPPPAAQPKAQPKAAPKPEPKPVAKPQPAPKPAKKPAEKPKPQPKPAAQPAPKKPDPKKPAPAAASQSKANSKTPAKPAAKPAAKPVANATGKATAKGTKAQSSGSKLKLDTSDWVKSSSNSSATNSKPSAGAQATTIGPAQKSALDAEIRRQIKPHWKAPTGADVESLRTIVELKLARDGSIIGEPRIVDTTGVTASNRTQVRLHQEQAIKAVKLAAPFRLPANFYSAWQTLQINLDKRLSQ